MQRVFSVHVWESGIGQDGSLSQLKSLNNGTIHLLSNFNHETNVEKLNFDFRDVRTSIVRVPIKDDKCPNIPFVEALYVEPPESVELYQKDPIILLYPHGGPHGSRFVFVCVLLG